MKKILLSTTLLVATAGVAAAEVTLSGSGRFGINYSEARVDRETRLEYRMRVEFNGKIETDSGVTFGGRVRLQNTQSGGQSTLSAAYVSASYAGFQVQVGNANGALDSAALMYNSEIGYTGFSAGDPIGINASFSSGPYTSTPNRVGVFVTYGIENFNVYASYHTLDQTSSTSDEIYSIAADYKFGAITISGGYENYSSTGGDTDTFAIAGEYAVNDAANIGLQYFDYSDNATLDQSLVTLYGNYTFDAITLRAFVASGDNLGTEDAAYGIGVDYDLGGATLAAGIQKDFSDNTYAEAGVKFSF